MKLVVVALYDENYLSDTLLAMTSSFGGRITIIDAVSGREDLSSVMPIFSDFGGGRSRFCKLLLCAADVDKPVRELMKSFELGGIDFAGSRAGEVYAISLEDAVLIED